MEVMIPIVMFICIAAVAILRPLTTRLGGFLEQMTRDRQTGRHDDAEFTRMRVQLDHMAQRLELMEERIDFTERLVARPRNSAPEPLLPTDEFLARGRINR